MDKYVIMIVAILILNINVMHNILGDENWLTSGLTSTKNPLSAPSAANDPSRGTWSWRLKPQGLPQGKSLGLVAPASGSPASGVPEAGALPLRDSFQGSP